MSYDDFITGIQKDSPPEESSIYLKALWHDAKGDWDAAHKLIDSIEDKTACWVHAYLHRKEGDQWNANYWYKKAGKTMPLVSLTEEWETIVKALL